MNLTTTLIALGLAGLLSMGVMTTMKNMQSSSTNANAKSEIEALRLLIMQEFDCATSLKVPANAKTPLVCSKFPAGSIKLMSTGKNGGISLTDRYGKMGSWSLSGRCLNNEVIISATRAGIDPLTGKTWASYPFAKDIFSGGSNLCKRFFDPSFKSCASDERMIGWAGNVAVCAKDEPDRPPFIAKEQMYSSSTNPVEKVSTRCPKGMIMRGCFGYLDNCVNASACNYLGSYINSNNACVVQFDPDESAGTTAYVRAICGWAE